MPKLIQKLQAQENGWDQQNQNSPQQKVLRYQSECTKIIDKSYYSKIVQVTTCLQKKNHIPDNKMLIVSDQNLPLMFLITQIMQTIQNNQTRACKYLLFHVPFSLCIASLLQIHQKPRSLLAFEILKQELRCINQLLIKYSGQIDEFYVKNIMAEIICFEKIPKMHFLRRLEKFLDDFRAKMSTFLPYYYHTFLFVVQSEGIKTIVQIQDKFRAKVKEIRSRYHNFDLS